MATVLRIGAWFLKQVAADPKRYANVAETWYEEIMFDEALQSRYYATLDNLSQKEIKQLEKQGYSIKNDGKTVHWE